MALSKQATANAFGRDMVFDSAYITVLRVDGSKNFATADVQTLTEKGGAIISVLPYSFTPSMDGRNFIAQAYDFIKTLPEFAGAVDC